MTGVWHCVQLPNGANPVVVCEREDLRKEVARLQALIDGFARAWADHVRTGSLGHERPFHALMAAATKEDDRAE